MSNALQGVLPRQGDPWGREVTMLRTLFFTLILSPLDTSNSVYFETHTGTADGIENIPLVPFHIYQEIYKQPVV